MDLSNCHSVLTVAQGGWHLQLQDVVRLAIATGLGGLIGFEREFHDKPAGFRTIVLICVGACTFTIVSQRVGAPDLNSTRIAAQIVSGIGFLGAGAILRDRHNVIGLTTAATIWSVAAVGMAAGFGEIPLAVAGTIMILITLFLFDYIEAWIGDRRDIQDYALLMENADGAFERIDRLFREHGMRIRKRNCGQEGDKLALTIVAMGSKKGHETLKLNLVRSSDYTLRRST